ncbi:MAG: dihydrofolate reductase family protein [Rubrivivax sp.]
MSRPVTTLFMLSSVDGKISTGDVDARDFDRDLPALPGVGEGLAQYYELERCTDLFALNSGRVMAKIGVNEAGPATVRLPVSFVIADDHHLTLAGVDHLLGRCRRLFVATANAEHPVFQRRGAEGLEILPFEGRIDFARLLRTLKAQHGVERLTIQTGGTLNALLLRQGLVDRVSLVLAPALVGGATTPTLVDGPPLRDAAELRQVKALVLNEVRRLQHSWLLLDYEVLNGEGAVGG